MLTLGGGGRNIRCGRDLENDLHLTGTKAEDADPTRLDLADKDGEDVEYLLGLCEFFDELERVARFWAAASCER